MQPRWARLNVTRCYEAFVEEFDNLHDAQVIWDPYSMDAQQRRAPYFEMSPLCYRDRTFWLTKEKLVFDVHVKDYSPHRVMRQFSLHQEFPPPDADTLPIAKQR